MKSMVSGVATLALLLCGVGQTKADLIYTLATDGSNNSASADFKFVTGGIEVSVTNTGSTTNTDSANAISQVVVSFNPATVGLPTSFTELSGHQITYAGMGSGVDQGLKDFMPPSTDPNLHWALTNDGSSKFGLINVSGPGNSTLLTGPGGQPQEMIVPLNATTPSNSLLNFNPSFNGTANFFLAFSKLPTTLTTADITGVSFSFGTGPEDTLQPGTGSGITVPEPSSIMVAFSGLIPAGLYLLRRRWSRKSQAAGVHGPNWLKTRGLRP